ncbi:MAG: hypothetical protein JO023_11415 [Chloroflexi bacterium]|nr:hypothetical protein [Chloroflexota bacterium]
MPGEEQPGRRHAAASDAPIVYPIRTGQHHQLGALRQVATTVAGSGQLVLVPGEAGIGKSRPVGELVTRLARLAGATGQPPILPPAVL